MISRSTGAICGLVPPRNGYTIPSSGREPHLAPLSSRTQRRFNPFGALEVTSVKGLRSGHTTGTCAAAAARAAACCLLGEDGVGQSAVDLPDDGERVSLPVLFTERGDGWAMAGVRKSAGDDPDDTDGDLSPWT